MGKKEIIAKISTYWDDYATKFDAEHDTEDIGAWGEALRDCLGADGPSSILDLGTGTGFLANLAAGLGHYCVGLDISQKMLKIAVEKSEAMGNKNIYMLGDVLDLPFAENTFDFIVNARLLWTLVDPLKAVSHWVHFIKPGGKIISLNRFKEGVGMCGGQKVYGEQEVDQAIVLAHASSEELTKLFKEAGLAEVIFKALPGLTKPEHASGFDPWHALVGSKPRQ
jgi:ubiquinone/menaquinone biosynthesis C-methylase UbiE